MSFHVLELLSGLACVVFCALLAAVCVRAKLRTLLDRAQEQESGLPASQDKITQSTPKSYTQRSRLAITLAACAGMIAFLGMPFGSLPSLLPFRWGGLVVLGCLALALGFEGEWTWDGAARRKTRALALLGLALALFAWYARQRGVPGELFSLDSYMATPLAGLMGWQGWLGMLLLALAILLAVRDVQQDLASGLARLTRLAPDEARAAVILALVRQIWILAVLGVAACLFAPLYPTGLLGMSGVAGIAADALVFWLKLLIADHVLWLTAKTLPQTSVWLPRAQVLLTGCGALCIFFA